MTCAFYVLSNLSPSLELTLEGEAYDSTEKNNIFIKHLTYSTCIWSTWST